MQLQRRAAVGCGPCPSAAVHDRQAVRKHLRRWSHNMVLIIGLERIAEELMGRRKWHQYQDILAKNYLLEEELMDRREWVPVKTCNSCDVNTDLNVTDHSPAELEPSSETGSLSGGSRSAESPEPEPGRRPSSTTPPAALKPCRAHDRSASPLPQPPPSTSSLLQELSKNPAAAAAAAAAMAAVVSLNNASSSQSSKTSAGGPPSPNALDAAAVASGLPQWLLIEATRRLQETAAAAVAAEAAARSRSPLPERRHHHHQQPQQPQQQQSLDQPLDLSAKSNSNNGSSSPSDAKNVPPGPAIIPFPSDLIATDMVNSLSNLIPNASLLQTLKVPSLIAHNRNVFKSKTTKQPSHMPGRKTYTEEKLQKALRDIQSGKLGTRRAAVIYGIPRSTLRNKVYKMAMERESGGAGTCRDDASRETAVDMLLTPEDEDDDDRDTASAGEEDCPRVAVDTVQTTVSAADEDKDGRVHHAHRQQPKTPSFVTVEDLFRITAEQQQQQQAAAGMPTPETIRLFLQHYANSKLLQQARQQEHYRGGANTRTDYRSPSPPPSAARLPPPVAPDLWPAAAAVLDPGKYLTQFLTTSVTATAPSPRLPSSPPPMSSQLPPRPRNPQEFFKDVSVMEMMTKLLDDEQKQYGKSVDWRRRLSSNGCNSSEPMDTGRCNDDDSNSTNFILRIPTYNTVPGKGSEYEPTGPARELQSPPERANSVRSDTSSPPSSSGGGGGGKHPVSLRDVIAKSITHKLQTGNDPPVLHHMPAVDSIALAYHQYQQQQQHQQQGATAVFRNHNNNNLLDDYRKRVPTPTSRPTSGQHTPASGSSGGGGFHHAGVSSNSSASAAVAAVAAAAAAISGGKGTRPKRGKYRNYDRDSLVEAVRAVQRGEMSVHRAGSFYGVPHSTLEYKVKERHLLRTRKREPKNRPSATSVSADTAAEQDRKNSTDPLSPQSSSSSSLSVRPVDKCATSAGTAPAVKLPAHVFPSQQTSLQPPNGLKMFDTTTGVPVGAYQQPFPFWAPSPFHMPIDFQRNPVQAYTSMSMIQRIQAESRLHHHHQQQQQQQQQATATATASITSLGKNAREVAENLYDGTDNGSFLDGIIRSSLETGLKSAAAVQAAEKSGGGGRPVAATDSSPERGVPNDRRSRSPPPPPPPPPAQDEDGNDGRWEDEQAATTPARFEGSASSGTDGEDEKPIVGRPPDGSERAVSRTSSPERAVDADEEDNDDDDDWSTRPPSKVKRVV